MSYINSEPATVGESEGEGAAVAAGGAAATHGGPAECESVAAARANDEIVRTFRVSPLLLAEFFRLCAYFCVPTDAAMHYMPGEVRIG